MKIVVLDGYTENPGDLSWEGLEALGEVTVYDRTAYQESPLIAERIGDAEVVVMNKTPISRETLDKCPNVKLIAVLATGYNVVDYGYAKEKGIPVVNVPTYGTMSVSQYSIALLLEICHHIGHHSASVYAGNWANNVDWCYWDYPLIELDGKTIGIVGFGRIGQAEGRIAKAMGMKVLAYDVYPNDFGREIGEYVDLDTLLRESDVITLHCNLTPENTGLINKDTMAHLFGVQDKPFGEINVAAGMWTTRTTSHIPIKEVSDNLTIERIYRAITLCHTTLSMAGFENPRIGVAALNPHCGEGGLCGREEIDVIAPAIEKAKGEGMNPSGPYSSDILFIKAFNGDFDGVVTMYHDQGQIALKLKGFDGGITIAGGQPVPVVTCGHGTAYDIAGKNIVHTASFENAVKMCSQMAVHNRK